MSKIKEIATYWFDTAECQCDSPLPIGSCFKCDMAEIIIEESKKKEDCHDDCGTTHYAGCACHEKGWENKWRAAVEMAAIASLERDDLREKLAKAHRDFGFELRDPNGTIWDAAAKMQSEIGKLKDQIDVLTQDAKQSELDCLRALGERNDIRLAAKRLCSSLERCLEMIDDDNFKMFELPGHVDILEKTKTLL